MRPILPYQNTPVVEGLHHVSVCSLPAQTARAGAWPGAADKGNIDRPHQRLDDARRISLVIAFEYSLVFLIAVMSRICSQKIDRPS